MFRARTLSAALLASACVASTSGIAAAQCPTPTILQASDRSAWDLLGLSGVAFRQNLLITAAPFDDNARGTDVGALYVYRRTLGSWGQSQKLLPPVGVQTGSWMGYAVATDGFTLAAYVRDPLTQNDIDYHGMVAVYENQAGSFVYKATLQHPAPSEDDWFGWRVGVAGDWIATGAFGADNAAGQNAGELRLFKRTNGVWANHATWTLSPGNAGAGLGISLAMSGQYLAAGASGADVGAIDNAGRVMVLRYTGAQWAYDGMIESPNPQQDANFGASIAISGDRMLVGAPRDTTVGSSGNGVMYVFRRDQAGWVLEGTLVTAGYRVWLGEEVALSDWFAYSTDSYLGNGARVFRRVGTQWVESDPHTIPDDGEGQGWMNALAASGDELAIGHADQNDGSMRDSGSVHLFGGDRDAGNDACAMAFPIGAGSFSGCTSTATTDGSSSCGTNTGKDVWYRYTAGVTGKVVMDTNLSQFDTVLSLHSGCPGTGANTLACDDDAGAGTASQLRLNVTAGQEVLVRVAGYNQASGAFFLNVAEFCKADFNADGQVDFFDYLDFAAAFDNEEPAADFNGDAQVDFFDYLDFAAAFDAGC